MNNVVIIITEGKNNPSKVVSALNFAWKAKKNNLFDDVKIFFYGESEEFIANTDDPSVLEAYNEVINCGITPHACVSIAKAKNIAAELNKKNIALASSTGVISELLSKGYNALTF